MQAHNEPNKLIKNELISTLIQVELLRHKAEWLNLYDQVFRTLNEIQEKRCNESTEKQIPGTEFATFTICTAAKQFFLMLNQTQTDFMDAQHARYGHIAQIQKRMHQEFKLFEKETLQVLRELKQLNALDPRTSQEFDELSEKFADLLKKYAQPKEIIEHHTTHGQN
jgi:hypothetical protein